MIARTRHGELQLPVDTYCDRTGRTVTLVGMVHVADPAFYDQVAEVVAERETDGATVQYERISKAPVDAARTPEEDALLARLDKAPSLSRLAEVLGLDLQHRTRIPVQPQWQNTDITALELLRMLPDAEDFVARQERAAQVKDDLDEDVDRVTRWAGRWMIRNLGWLYPPVTLLFKLSGRQRNEMRAIIDHRNFVALAALLGTHRDVVAMWGAGHVKGIGRGLADHGFRRVHRRWVTAVNRDVSPPPRHLFSPRLIWWRVALVSVPGGILCGLAITAPITLIGWWMGFLTVPTGLAAALLIAWWTGDWCRAPREALSDTQAPTREAA